MRATCSWPHAQGARGEARPTIEPDDAIRLGVLVAFWLPEGRHHPAHELLDTGIPELRAMRADRLHLELHHLTHVDHRVGSLAERLEEDGFRLVGLEPLGAPELGEHRT